MSVWGGAVTRSGHLVRVGGRQSGPRLGRTQRKQEGAAGGPCLTFAPETLPGVCGVTMRLPTPQG